MTRHEMLADQIQKRLFSIKSFFEKVNLFHETILVPLYKGLIQIPKDKTEERQFAEALLYCPDDSEMSDCLDWFDMEEAASGLYNLTLSIGHYYYEIDLLNENLMKSALPHFKDCVMGLPFGIGKKQNITQEDFERISAAEFAPNENDKIHQAYVKVVSSLEARKLRHHDRIKIVWRDRLKKIAFQGLYWEETRKEATLEEHLMKRAPKIKEQQQSPRWDSSLSLHKLTYAKFVRYFIDQFLDDPKNRNDLGETVCFLWIAICIAHEPSLNMTVKKLLKLQYKDIDFRIDQCCLKFDNKSIPISIGLRNILEVFLGKGSQKIFPNLTEDRLADLLKRASKQILPADEPPALAKAFLTFPHIIPGNRMHPRQRNLSLINPPKVFPGVPTRHEILVMLNKHLQSFT